MKPDFQRRIQKYGWDKAARYYESSWKRQLKPAQDRLVEIADVKPGEKVLETACGSGLITFPVAGAVEPAGEVVATDISDNMVEMAEKMANERQIRNVTFKSMDAENLDLDDSSFDIAICGLGLMYVPDPVRSLKEMHRVLRPGGRAVVLIWGERKNCGWADIFPVVDKRVASDVCPMFFQQGTGRTIEYSYQEAGFQSIHTERFKLGLNFATPEDAVIAAFSGGPVALAYNKFDDQTRRDAHEEYLESIASYQVDNGYEIPGEFVVATGYKP